MFDPVDALVRDLVDSIGLRPRRYADVIEAWRTSCPRLPVWEEAHRRGLLVHSHPPGGPALVQLSPAGVELLADIRSRRAGPPAR